MTTTEPASRERASGDVDPWALITAAQAGDAEAFGELYEKYASVVFRYVLFRVGDRTLAEDLTSETFLRALHRITSVTYQGRDPGAWFITIAKHLIYDHCKSSSYRLDRLIPDFGAIETRIPWPRRGGDTGNSVADHDTTRLITQVLLDAISELTGPQREVVMLRFFDELSVEATAEVMNREIGAVKALQHRAVRQLAKRAGPVLRELRDDH